MFIFVLGTLGCIGYKVWKAVNSATKTMEHVDETLVSSRRTMVVAEKTMTDMQDTMVVGKKGMSDISTSIDRSLTSICWNFSLITNAVLGLAACWALYFLANCSDFMHPTIRFGIWNIIAFICCWMIIKYFEHSDMLERSRSNKTYSRYNKKFKLLLSILVSFVATAITYGLISYFYYGNAPTGGREAYETW